MSKRYKKSEDLLKRAEKVIPLGSQTFSKSRTQFPYGVSPYFIERGEGSHVWDVDGHEYVDFINALSSVTLGYNDPDVNAAVSAQLQKGSIFSLPHILETEVAEKIVSMVPCAEKVRFGKNGSDATAGAIRLARAYTGRDHVAVCGYHGWQDWYIGSTARNKGVPQTTKSLTHKFNFNDLSSLEKLFSEFPDQIAAVILEPMNTTYPTKEFLDGVRKLTEKNKTILVFDETITGFRYAKGGAQELFGVTPDLATFGKGLANGYPLSAVVGKNFIMKLMEDIFFSFTFGGETLSLAAAKATLEKLEKSQVIPALKEKGEKVISGVNALIQENGLSDFISVAGHPSWSFLLLKDKDETSQWLIRTLLLQEMFANGVLTFGTHNMSLAHSDDDIKKLLDAYRKVFPLIKKAVESNKVKSYLQCDPLEPLFKVR